MNRIIVITGASSGIGKALREIFEKEDIVIGISRSEDSNKKNSYICDITKEDELSKVFKDIKDKFGRIDILINNAGYGHSGATELVSMKDARDLFEVNFFAALRTIQLTLPLMPQSGRIINISSASAFFPMPFRSLYSASKAAVLILSESVGIEVAKTGIKTTAICPGEIKTNFTKARVKNFETNERYGKAIENSAMYIDSHEDTRMDLNKAVAKIHKIIEKKRYRPRYVIGGKYKIMYVFDKLMPRSLTNLVIRKLFYKTKEIKIKEEA